MKNRRKLSKKQRIEIIESVMGKMPKNKFEPDVFNYCDRWCEKCDKTEKCRVYYDNSLEKAKMIAVGLDPDDPKNAFNMVEKSFIRTAELIQKISKVEGIDLTRTDLDNKNFEIYENKTDHSKDPLYKKVKKLTKDVHEWLETTPSLDFKDYKDEYDKLAWHYTIVEGKIARSISSKKEANLEKGDLKKYSLDDSKKSGWVVYRSATICKEALEYMDSYVRDFRIMSMRDKFEKIIQEIDKKLL